MSKPCPLCGQPIPDDGTVEDCMQDEGYYWAGVHRQLPYVEMRVEKK